MQGHFGMLHFRVQLQDNSSKTAFVAAAPSHQSIANVLSSGPLHQPLPIGDGIEGHALMHLFKIPAW